ncbi:(d)CMP kinase [Amycolatopsis acidiphila]|uniref:Cytidylate kinase n=1 Tax=Amycolatopsis acidiphila TaxID=715473 RepID=A0A558A4U8_9PSEU|nr:(d)CMP kinase [Amycolatopsis acidiphila]TVT19291.1 (d)CMP kinase [Amycolatopsis acidiphila]UIJ63836.1 (d)CMP kinase [Amycolatopsis acidiphila]
MVALDGPSGTGKTTVARKLAERLSAGYLDTGAMYRVVTLAVLRAGVDPADADAVAATARDAVFTVGTTPVRPAVTLAGADVSAEIRGPEVNHAVSPVSAVPAVRELLVARQRRIIDEVLAEVGGIVVEGRDIGTVVAPDSPLKVYLTASPEIRAARRSAQDNAAGRRSTQADALASVDRRDRLDSSRAASPLRAAPDAVHLDTSELEIDQVLVALSELASRRGLLDCAAEVTR